MVQGRLGRPPLAAKREQFGRLIARGIGNAEACRIVGVHLQTGKRWRRGRVMTSSSGARLHYAPVTGTRKQVISGRFLSERGLVSRTCGVPGSGCGLSPRGWSAARRRSAGSCAATGTLAAGSTGRSPRSGWRPGAVPGPVAAS